jgi:hypothetical protein
MALNRPATGLARNAARVHRSPHSTQRDDAYIPFDEAGWVGGCRNFGKLKRELFFARRLDDRNRVETIGEIRPAAAVGALRHDQRRFERTNIRLAGEISGRLATSALQISNQTAKRKTPAVSRRGSLRSLD